MMTHKGLTSTALVGRGELCVSLAVSPQ